jgi:hypothetical protein
LSLLPKSLVRLSVALWLRTNPDSWRREVIAADSPHLHEPGVILDRVLLAGDGVASGRGVLTHEIGLPGYLARSLSARTGRVTAIDVVVDQDMTVLSCFTAIIGMDLSGYDVVVLSVGHNEALSLMSVKKWRSGLRSLLGAVTGKTSATAMIFLLSIPMFGPRTSLPTALATAVDSHAKELNAATDSIIAMIPGVMQIPMSPSNEFEPETTGLYRRWAGNIATQIGERLNAE